MLQEKQSFWGLGHSELKDFVVGQLGLKPFLAKQVFDWAYRKWNWNPEEWSNIKKENRELIAANLDFELPRIAWHGKSVDGTRKFLLAMKDGKTVEAVAIPAKNRLTLCLSSQVGCAVGCTFCHTATQGLSRHLKSHEVVGEFVAVQKWLIENVHEDERLTNIVYMGQGEPLHNFEAMKTATQIFLEPNGIGFGQRRITLSTSGLVPQIKKLGDFPPVNIAISLHATRDDIRTELMPINKVYDLKRLFEAIREIPLKAHRRITYEYLLIDGFNDGMEDIEGLCKLLKRTESKVNLIPFNEYPESKYKRPSVNRILWFQDQLIARGYTCTIRTTKGDDILAACGQLKSQVESSTVNI